mmetsp:Transcript_24893/g.42539  ORF Transcript_24893/g.42539 Transcript_24893/m.42539 type:complete len:167 (-) Transcript_24893:255-755(-)
MRLLRACVLATVLLSSDAFRTGVCSGLRAHPAVAPPALRMLDSGYQFNPFDALKGSFERLTDWRVARASHILLKGFDDASVAQLSEWKAEIGGDLEKFAEIARNYSQCPSRSKGGDLGFFTRGKMVKEFDYVVFNEEPGGVYGPVRTNFGNHLIFIVSCREPKEGR